MTLASRLADLVSAIGADIKNLRTRMTTVENSTTVGSSSVVINAATSLIQTQKVMAETALRGYT